MSTTLPELPAMPALDSQTERVEVWGLMQDYAHAYGLAVWKEAMERAAEIIQAEIDRAAALLNVDDAGKPLFNREQTEAGICALQTVLDAIRSLPDPSVIQQGAK